MAYNDVNKIFEDAKALIISKQLYFMEDVTALLPIAKSTFYDYFKTDSVESNTLKGLLNENRVNVKVKMRKNWEASENATLQMGLYKLIANDTERQHLSQTHVDVKSDGKEIKPQSIELVLSDGRTYDDLKNELKPE